MSFSTDCDVSGGPEFMLKWFQINLTLVVTLQYWLLLKWLSINLPNSFYICKCYPKKLHLFYILFVLLFTGFKYKPWHLFLFDFFLVKSKSFPVYRELSNPNSVIQCVLYNSRFVSPTNDHAIHIHVYMCGHVYICLLLCVYVYGSSEWCSDWELIL